jgi:hypothetical protein
MRVLWKTLFFLSLSLAAAGQVRSVETPELSSLLPLDTQVEATLHDGKTWAGRVIKTSPDSLALAIERPAGEKSIAYADIGSITIRRWRGNKRTWLPLTLCGTVGALSFVAAGATEERKGTHLPLAAGVTVALGIGGYYAGRALDREEITYAVKHTPKSARAAPWSPRDTHCALLGHRAVAPRQLRSAVLLMEAAC